MDQYLNIESSEEVAINGAFNFLERNVAQVDKVEPSYFLFEVWVAGVMKAKKSLFTD